MNLKNKVVTALFICFTLNSFSFYHEEKANAKTMRKYSKDISPKKLKKLVQTAPWKTKQVADGILWKYFQFPDIFNSSQSITIFDVDLSKPISINFPYAAQGSFLKTSEAGKQTSADVAINGSYFNTKIGGSTTYFKHNGTLIAGSSVRLHAYREDAAFVLDALGKPSIRKKPAGGWDDIDAPNILTSGPLLVYNGKPLEQQNTAFNNNRHPRTIIGLTKNKHLLMLVVDGRSADSQGLSTPELADLMMALGCDYAMNLDGGGSATAWVKGEGVVSYPSDNKKFDHAGERSVATVITVTAK